MNQQSVQVERYSEELSKMEPSYRQEGGARKPEERMVSGQAIFQGAVNSKVGFFLFFCFYHPDYFTSADQELSDGLLSQSWQGVKVPCS